MVVQGKAHSRRLLSKHLSPTALVALVRDVLFIRGHRNIRVTDGPGDGTRDVHSIDVDGNKHLTQCKFHASIEKTCASSELSELPVGLLKFRYKHGLFVTNAKISPQGKREYLDNYSDFVLEFMTGDELVDEVLSSALLRLAWMDDKDVRQLAVQFSFPIAVRLHQGDVPLDLHYDRCGVDMASLCRELEGRWPETIVRLAWGQLDPGRFSLYRPPRFRTFHEGGLRHLLLPVLSVQGRIEMDRILDFAENAVQNLAGRIAELHSAFTVMAGGAKLSIAGDGTGASVDVPETKCVSLTQTIAASGWELSWFDWCKKDTLWTNETDASVTEADWIRLFNPQHEFCLTYEIQSGLDADRAATQRIMRQQVERDWKRSVFCLATSEYVWPSEIDAPDQSVPARWHPGKRLFAWTYFYPMPPWPEGVEDGDWPFSEPPKGIQARLEHIRTVISSLDGCMSVAPEEAYHLLRAQSVEPFPSTDELVFRTAETSCYLHHVPHPILPATRRFALTCAWRTAFVPVDAKYERRFSCFGYDVRLLVELRRDGEYLICEATVHHSAIEDLPTVEVVRDAEVAFLEVVAEIEAEVHRDKGSTSRCTQSYWKAKYGVGLGISWRTSGKTYVMVNNGGRWEAADWRGQIPEEIEEKQVHRKPT